jgi:hypothetical protein
MNEDLAKKRFIVMQMVRLAGVAIAMIGLLAIAGKIDLPREAGIALFVVGLIEAMLLPTLLVRNWKTPPQ